MPRAKNWRKSVAKKGNILATKETVDVTEDPGLIKNRSDVTEDPGLIKNRSDCNKVRDTDPLPIAKNSIKYARNKQRDTDPLPIAKNSSKNDQEKCLRAEHDESSKKRLRAQNESANSGLRAQNESAHIRLQAHNQSSNTCLRAHDESEDMHIVADVESQTSCRQADDGDGNRCVQTPKASDVLRTKIPSNIYNKETFFASHHQGDARYSAFSRGSQCTCMSLSIILTMFDDSNFSSVFLDKVLYHGDNLYKKVVMDLMNEGKFKSKLLSFDELPKAVEYNDKLYSITKHTSVIGIPIVDSTTSEAFSLHEAVVFALSKSDSLLIMIGAICSTLVRRDNRYIFFDSHSHGTDALSNADGKAVMRIFPLLDDVIAFLYAFYNSANIELTSQFEILPVSVQPIVHRFLDCQNEGSTSSQPNFLGINKVSKNNTNAGNTQNSQTNRLNYMKEYMRKKRQEKEFHDKELANKRKAREKEDYHQQEQEQQLASKRKARENKDYREEEKQKDLAKRRKAREDEKYREEEKQRELASKRKAREDEKYREEEKQKELTSKRKAREDENYREEEKQRELASKRKAREDENYREEEKQRDLANRRKAREDENYREDERQRELTSKRKARENVNFRKKEMLSKRLERCDEQFQQEEAKRDLNRKQNLRKDPLVLEQERLAKQRCRQDDYQRKKERQQDKSRKSEQRSNPEHYEAETLMARTRKYGSDIDNCIVKFHASIRTGPAYICCCCHQTWFFKGVSNVNEQSYLFKRFSELLTDVTSENKKWLCVTCRTSLQRGQIPKLSVANGMTWPSKPNELDLHPLEERLISLRIPFMQIRELPRGGQYCIKGNVVNVPVDIQPTINTLPRQMDENFTVPVKLKKKLAYKKCDFTENVRPVAVISALHWLMNSSSLYKESGINIDDAWIQRVTEDASDIVKEFTSSHPPATGNDLCEEAVNPDEPNDESLSASGDLDNGNNTKTTAENAELNHGNNTASKEKDGNESDNFSEVDADDNVIGNSDTLLDDEPVSHDRSYTFAPGEGQHPLSLYSDKDAEFLSFPAIFCGERRLENKDRKVPVHYSDIVKWELRSADRRAAQSVPNIFFKLKKIQLKQISDKVHLAIRRCKTKGKKITAAEARDQTTLDKIVKLDEGYYIFRQLRNSPAYLSSRKKDIFAMIRQLGLPTWFMSLSSADTRWPDLLKMLAKLNEGKNYSDEEIQKLTWAEKTKLIQKDPVTSSRFFDNRVQQFINIVLNSPHSPIGKVTDYFYRVEFQQRGSPHIHMIIWVENSPVHQRNQEKEIEKYVDNYVTCSNEKEEMKKLVDMQTHKHSKTCRKKGKAVCRFGFPLPPLPRTMLLEPLDKEVEKYQEKYDKIQEKMNNKKDGLQMTFEEFLQEIVELTEEEYVKCIRSTLNGPKVFLKRRPAEIRVNLYNEELLRAWNANMDLQFVLDPYACAMYIVSYISKSQRGMSALLDRACKEARQGNMDIKKQVRHIGNKFLNSVEVSAQEACYLLLQMSLTKGTRDVQFLNTSPPSERVFLLKQQSKLQELGPDSTDISCDNIIQRYSKRPKALENWCFADYCSQLDVKYPKNMDNEEMNEIEIEVNDDEIENNSIDETEEEGIHDGETDSKSEDDDFSDENTLLTLKNGIVIKRRRKDRIIRYVHYNKKSDPENHYREKLLLFMPWRNENRDVLGGYSCYKDRYESCRHVVDNKIKKYEHHIEELEQARQAVEEELDAHDELAPNAQQANAEDEQEGNKETDDYVHFNPERPVEHRQYDIGPDVGASTASMVSSSVAGRMEDEQYYQLARSLNDRQREFFQHVLHWIKSKEDPLYAFLSGGAGVGKSVLIRVLYQALHRLLHSGEGEDPDDIRILLCAFTGKAAYNINGVTIASAFHKKYNQLNQAMNSDELNTFRTKYRNLSVIIIDEISMVGNKMLNFIDSRLKELTGTNRPFGGKSIIAVGDLYQLQPVGDSWIFNDLSHGPQILATNLWQEHFQMYELTQIMRQRDDLHFADLLNRLRVNELTEIDRLEIYQHMVSHADSRYQRNVPHLFMENKFVDDFNDEIIKQLSGPKTTIQSHDTVVADLPKSTKERLLSHIPKDASKTANLSHSLTIAEGMIYDIAVNLDVNDGLANGSTCIAKRIEYRMHQSKRPSIVWVLFDDEKIGSCARQKYSHLYTPNIDPKWTPIFEVNRNFMYNYKSYQRIQFPLKASAAKTVHKAQGSTVDRLVIDLKQNKPRKIPHIHYVALSRVRKLQNLQILNFNEDALTVDDRVKTEMDRLRTESLMPLCFLPLYNINSDYFKVALNNARSFHKHFVDLAMDPNIMSADVVGITESRLIHTDEDLDYILEGYQMLRNDQILHQSNRRPAHGLVLYVKHDFSIQRVVKHSTALVEFLLAEVHSDKLDCLQLVVMYKAPTCTMNEYMAYVNAHLKQELDVHKPFMVLGDFNFDLTNGNVPFQEFMVQTFRCSQHVQESTTDYGSLLDLVFSNIANVFTGIVECYWSDHKIVFASFPFTQ